MMMMMMMMTMMMMVIIWFDDDVIGGGDYDEDSNNDEETTKNISYFLAHVMGQFYFIDVAFQRYHHLVYQAFFLTKFLSSFSLLKQLKTVRSFKF